MMIDLTASELQALAGLIDAGVRHAGIRALTAEAVSILSKLQSAADAANTIPSQTDN